jgi:F0F1-type ATP synthase assembly protein I
MPETEKEETARKSGIAYAAALTLFMSVAVMTGLGWALDRWFATAPWLLVAGLVLGAVAGFYQFVRLTSKL